MFTKILAITAFTLSLSGAAFAQEASGSGSGTNPSNDEIVEQLPESWSAGGVDKLFFSDTTAGTLRSDAEITSAWTSMNAEQQTMVKADCEARYGASGESATENSDQSGTATVESAGSMSKLCTMINAM
jgi:hypothetical protein